MRLMQNNGVRSNPGVRSRLWLSLLLFAALHVQGENLTGRRTNRDHDIVARNGRRRIKKKGPKHFSLDALVDGFDDDEMYFISYNEKKKSSGKSGKKKKCKGKSGRHSSKKKKKGKKESASSSNDSDDMDDGSIECTASPTMLVTDAPTITPTIEPTEVPTVSPTMRPTSLSPTLQPTITRTDAPTSLDEDSEASSEKSKKSKKGKEKKEKAKGEKSKVRVSPRSQSDDTSKGSTRAGKVKGDASKSKLSPHFRAEIPIAIPFPSKAPLRTPMTVAPSLEPTPSIMPIPQAPIELPVSLIRSSTTYFPSATREPAAVESILPTGRDSMPSHESDTKAYAKDLPTKTPTSQGVHSTTIIEASAFYVTFMLPLTALDPTNSDMKQAIAVCSNYLETYAQATFALIDGSSLAETMSAPFSFSPDFTSIELLTTMEFQDESEFIPSTEDIDMLLEIAFTEPSVGTLLELLAELPYDNPFHQTTSVVRVPGSLQLQLSQSSPLQSNDSASSTSSTRGTVVGACAAAFVVVAFAAVYRNRDQYRKRRKLGRRRIDHPDLTAGTNESSIGAPTLMEQLVDDYNEINTIEFYGDDDEDPDCKETLSHQGSLFESPFLQGELPKSFNEV